MKKVMYLVAFLMSAVWGFSSCSDDDSTTKPGDESSILRQNRLSILL